MSLDSRILEMIKKYIGLLVPKKVLKTMEEVEANTNGTNLVAAPVVAELSNKLAGVRTYVDTDGKLHSVDGTGADTVLNFKKFNSLVYGIPSDLKKGDWVIIGGSHSSSAYCNMQPSNISGGKLIFYADSGGAYTQYVAIIEAITSTVSFTPGFSETKGVRACLKQ